MTTTAPRSVFPNHLGFKGSNPNDLALSPDEGTLFVTNGGTHSAAVIQLGMNAIDPALAGARQTGGDDGDNEEAAIEDRADRSHVIGLVPTGWYPDAVEVSRDGDWLYVVNGKDNAGPNPGGCRDNASEAENSANSCLANNQYMWQLERRACYPCPCRTPGIWRNSPDKSRPTATLPPGRITVRTAVSWPLFVTGSST